MSYAPPMLCPLLDSVLLQEFQTIQNSRSLSTTSYELRRLVYDNCRHMASSVQVATSSQKSGQSLTHNSNSWVYDRGLRSRGFKVKVIFDPGQNDLSQRSFFKDHNFRFICFLAHQMLKHLLELNLKVQDSC